MGINLYPTLIPDGLPEPTYPYNYDQLVGVINDRLAIPSPCTIGVSGSLVNGDLTVNVTVTKDAGAQMPNARVQVVVTEIDIPYNDPNYNNEMNFVNRDMILDHTGTVLTFTGNTAEVSVCGMLDPTWTQENLIIVVWVEDGSTLEVYQATREYIEIFLADPNAPAIPTDFVTTPDPTGTLSCDLSWTNPSLDFSGNPLTELLEMRLYRDGDLIYTDSNPSIGGASSYTDVPSDPGLYNYMILGYNSFGEGPGAVATTWIGEDVPNVVENLLLVEQGGNGYITWTNPTTGLNGGAFNNPILGYHIERSDGVMFEVTGIQTDYLDTTIPAPDYYYYTATPYNLIGDGGSETSNTEWLGESFSGIVILDLDPTSTGAALQTAIQNNYAGQVVLTSDWNAYPLTSDVEALFILLGIFASNYTLLEAEVLPATNYLDGGGCVYMEGGDTWAYDTQTSLHGYFNLNGTLDGSSDLSTVTGADFLSGMTWS